MALNLSVITYSLRVRGWTSWVMCDLPDVRQYNIFALLFHSIV